MFWKRTSELELQTAGAFAPSVPKGPRLPRNSSGWGMVLPFLKQNEGGVAMDVGPTSASNVNFLTELGYSIFLPDPVQDFASGAWAERMAAAEGAEQAAMVREFLEQSFSFAGREFDCVLLWDTLDYLPEPLLQPLVDAIHRVTRPGAHVLCYFRSRMEQLPETGVSPYRRFHVTNSNVVEGQGCGGYVQRQMLQNRAAEKMFHQFSSSRFMLAGDNFREAVFIR